LRRLSFRNIALASDRFNTPNLAVPIVLFYALVVLLGILSMGFQLLASRMLNPFFGSSLIVWSWLISTFLAAFSLGSIIGGWISNAPLRQRERSQWIVGTIAVGSLAFTAFLGRAMLGQIEIVFTEITSGLLVACLALFFLPVTTLSSFGPQCVQYLASRGTPPGKASGLIYGVSTLGNIAGVMLTAFVLIPHLPVSTLLYLWLGVSLVNLTALIFLLRSSPKTSAK
jgi:MFS family permease